MPTNSTPLTSEVLEVSATTRSEPEVCNVKTANEMIGFISDMMKKVFSPKNIDSLKEQGDLIDKIKTKQKEILGEFNRIKVIANASEKASELQRLQNEILQLQSTIKGIVVPEKYRAPLVLSSSPAVGKEEMITPTFACSSQFIKDDALHGYSESFLRRDFPKQVSAVNQYIFAGKACEAAAKQYEERLELGFYTLLLHAKYQKSESKEYGFDGKYQNYIFDSAPEHGGTKELYSVELPSRAKCLLGTRTMGDEHNYCFYPLAFIDPNKKSRVGVFSRAIQNITFDGKPKWIINGMHLTQPITRTFSLSAKTSMDGSVLNQKVSPTEKIDLVLCPVRQRPETTYLSKGSHVSFDIRDASEASLPDNEAISISCKFRVQFKPRIEIGQLTGANLEKLIVRCGRPFAIPLSVDSKKHDVFPEDLQDFRLIIDSNCTKGKLDLSQIKQKQGIESKPSEEKKEADKSAQSEQSTYKIEEIDKSSECYKVLEQLLKCRLYLAGHAQIAEILVIGYLMSEKIDAYKQSQNVQGISSEMMLQFYQELSEVGFASYYESQRKLQKSATIGTLGEQSTRQYSPPDLSLELPKSRPKLTANVFSSLFFSQSKKQLEPKPSHSISTRPK
jgi:hypothetical protein